MTETWGEIIERGDQIPTVDDLYRGYFRISSWYAEKDRWEQPRHNVSFDEGEWEDGYRVSGPSVACDLCDEVWWPPLPEGHHFNCPLGVIRGLFGIVSERAVLYDQWQERNRMLHDHQWLAEKREEEWIDAVACGGDLEPGG